MRSAVLFTFAMGALAVPWTQLDNLNQEATQAQKRSVLSLANPLSHTFAGFSPLSPPFGTLDSGGIVGTTKIAFGVDYSFGRVEGVFNDGDALAASGVSDANLVDLVTLIDARIVVPNTVQQALTSHVAVTAGFASAGTLLLEVFDVNGVSLGSAVNGGNIAIPFSVDRGAAFDIASFRVSTPPPTDTFGLRSVTIETPVASTSAGGDPHVHGLFGINLEVYGKPGANFSLIVAPAFEVNVQLANRGPKQRFMTEVAVLYRGTSIAIGPWDLKKRKAALIKHFEALGSRVVYEGEWRVTIEVCSQHKITLTTHHTANKLALNYLDLELSVPGCHDAYDGLLGQTYKCRWATDKFEWSRDKEDAFLLPTLTTPSGSYSSATGECANEDEYQGEPITGSSTSADGMTKMLLSSTR